MKKLLSDQSGATAVEYSLILAIIGAAIIVASLAMGASMGSAMDRTSGCIATAGTTC